MDARYSQLSDQADIGIVKFESDQTNKEINTTQKEIGQILKVLSLTVFKADFAVDKGGCKRASRKESEIGRAEETTSRGR
jgi:hypothetical protein